MKTKKYLVFGLVFAFIIVTLAAGCTPARRPIEYNTPNYNQDDTINTPNVTQAPGTLPNDQNLIDDGIIRTNEMDMTMRQQLEDRIANDVEKIQGVNDAVVIINGNTAYVGIDAGRNITDQKTNDLKDQVIDTARKADTRITKVYVSADMDAMERLRGFGRDIRAGRPITGFIDEIEDIFRRPLPTTR